MYICIYVYMYICIYVYMYICIYVYMYICIYVYMYICMKKTIIIAIIIIIIINNNKSNEALALIFKQIKIPRKFKLLRMHMLNIVEYLQYLICFSDSLFTSKWRQMAHKAKIAKSNRHMILYLCVYCSILAKGVKHMHVYVYIYIIVTIIITIITI